jgi:predicted nucleic acid-binding protein
VDPWQYLARFASNGLLIDTNLFLLYAVGLHDRSAIARFKRTNQYDGDDFDRVSNVVGRCSRLVTTPHILAEISNLTIDRAAGKDRPFLGVLLDAIRATRELHVEKDIIIEAATLPFLGFTDTSIVELAKRDGYLVLTDDLPLAAYLSGVNCAVINLNNLRSPDWLSKA